MTKKKVSCTRCGSSMYVDEKAIGGICSKCTMASVPGPDIKLTTVSDKPAGWKFMTEFVDKDGNVYHKGEIQKKLKGTLKPTDVAKIRKQQLAKRQLNKKKKAERELKKEEKLVKEYDKKRKIKRKK